MAHVHSIDHESRFAKQFTSRLLSYHGWYGVLQRYYGLPEGGGLSAHWRRSTANQHDYLVRLVQVRENAIQMQV